MAGPGRYLLVATLVATPRLALSQTAPAGEPEWSGSVAGALGRVWFHR
jgi:hypothetical protein